MHSQQLLDYLIKPTLEYMGGRYNSKNAQFLLLTTAAIESHCGYYVKQVNGPAVGIWQMEPETHEDIIVNCDALQDESFHAHISKLFGPSTLDLIEIGYPMYACAMARLKYSMDPKPLPDHKDLRAVYDYYKRIYNTPLGASTWEKFQAACNKCNITEVKL